MAIAKEVARVSGAVRCKRFVKKLGETRFSPRKFTDFTLSTILDDTKAFIRSTEKELLEKPSS